MAFDRFGQWLFDPVPLDALGLKWPKLQAMQAEVRSLINQHAEAARAVNELEAGRGGAREQDLDAGARALRAGSEVPPPKAEPALEKKVSGAVRTRDAFERAAASAIEDLQSFKRVHAASLQADATWSLEKLRGELAEKAKQTAALFAESEAAAASVKKLAPPAPPPPESTAAGKDTVYAPQFVARSRSADPERGEINRVLNFLGGGA